MYAEATKVCNGPLCNGKEKPLSEFYKSAMNADGRQSYCKACLTQVNNQWRRTPKGKAWLAEKRRGRRSRNPASHLLNRCRDRAKEKGMECSLTLEWIKQKLLAGVCEVTGISFAKNGSRHPFMPSIDRIDSSKGYTPENCRVVLWMINAAKNDLTEDDFLSALRQVAEAVVERC